MNGYDMEKAKQFLLERIDPKAAKPFGNALADVLVSFISYDFAYMRDAHVLDLYGDSGDSAYDEDDAFEFILDQYLEANPCTEKQEMEAAVLLDAYMPLQAEFLSMSGLSTIE